MKLERIRKHVILLIIIIGCTMVLIASLWNIDFVMWYKSAYWYYPIPGYWATHVEKHELGVYVNIQYYQITISYLIGCIASYLLGADKE